MRAVIVWPHPRKARAEAYLANRDRREAMDGLSGLRDHGIETIIIDSSPFPVNPLARRGTVLAGLDPWRFLRLLGRYRHYDVVLSIDTSSGFLLTQMKRLLHLKKPIVVIDPALDLYPNRKRIHDRVLPYVTEVVVYARAQQRYLREEFGDRVNATFIPHRIDTGFFDPKKAMSGAKGYVLAVGNDAARDYQTLCTATKGLDVRVIIHSKLAFEGEVPANVDVRQNWITFEDLRGLYAGAAAVVVPVHPSLHASGVNGLLEAMAMGKPVVASCSAGIADYLEDGHNAFVVPAEDPAALRTALDRLLADRQLQKTLGRQARAYCEQVCAIPVYSARVAAIIQRVVQP